MHFSPIHADAIQAKQKELGALIERLTGEDGIHSTAIASLDLIRTSHVSEPIMTVYEPSLCITAQGSKQMMLSGRSYVYSPHQYLLVSVDLPLVGRVIEATPAQPYLAMRLGINPWHISDILMEAQLPSLEEHGEGVPHTKEGGVGSALQISPLTPSLLDSVIRLIQLLENPHDIPVMYPLLAREILYRLLTGEQSGRLRQIAVSNSQIHRVARAIDWLKSNYTRTIRIEEVARVAHMSPSGFHQHFKEVTTMTPLQYQKQLRLQEARRLMLSEDIDAATASYRVGYESPSQFSREYSRLFGAPPLRDINQLRGVLVV